MEPDYRPDAPLPIYGIYACVSDFRFFLANRRINIATTLPLLMYLRTLAVCATSPSTPETRDSLPKS